MSIEVEERTIPVIEPSDWFLGTLVKIANQDSFEVTITLQVDGFLVSGLLVSGAKYFEGFAAEFASGFTGETANEVKNAISQLADMYKDKSSEDAAAEGSEGIPDARAEHPAYIHLREAHFFHNSGNPIPGNRGVWWRGRLSEVSGFVIGSLSHD